MKTLPVQVYIQQWFYEKQEAKFMQTLKFLVWSVWTCPYLLVGDGICKIKLIKVAHVVTLKLAFTEWFFYNLVLLIKLCKIWYLDLDKALLFPKNHVICLKIWKLWQAPTTTQFNIFCWNFAHVSYLTMSTKGFSGFCLDLELLRKT